MLLELAELVGELDMVVELGLAAELLPELAKLVEELDKRTAEPGCEFAGLDGLLLVS